MRFGLSPLLLPIFILTSSQTGKSDEEIHNLLVQCEPESYERALDCLDLHLPAKDKETLLSDDGLIDAHFGLGLFIRNYWGLWADGPLAKDLIEKGVTHPDDMSSVILKGYVARRSGSKFDLALEAEKYRKYWGSLSGESN